VVVVLQDGHLMQSVIRIVEAVAVRQYQAEAATLMQSNKHTE
jgi:hypothetical protein